MCNEYYEEKKAGYDRRSFEYYEEKKAGYDRRSFFDTVIRDKILRKFTVENRLKLNKERFKKP